MIKMYPLNLSDFFVAFKTINKMCHSAPCGEWCPFNKYKLDNKCFFGQHDINEEFIEEIYNDYTNKVNYINLDMNKKILEHAKKICESSYSCNKCVLWNGARCAFDMYGTPRNFDNEKIEKILKKMIDK